MVSCSFPQQINVKDLAKNSTLFWSTIKDLKNLGALLGAGSPPHPQGDSAFTPDGIVMGHAYAILQVRQYNGEVLVQLRNPHGAKVTTLEWTGDWGDDSD